MNIVVFGAAGKAGQRITREAAGRGHHVTAVARRAGELSHLPAGVVARTGSATEPESVRELAKGADALVLAIGGEDTSVWERAARTVVEALSRMSGEAPRLIHMGGGATLLAPDGTRFLDSPSFPAEFRASAMGQEKALEYYRALRSPKVRWTYVSPPPVHFAPGEKKGVYRTATDHPVTDAQGRAAISYEDFAMAIVDEIEKPRFVNTRFTVGY
jgi:putative NADH-flavin reductase